MLKNVAVDIQQVTKIYGAGNAAVTAVNDVTLQIYDNEFLYSAGSVGLRETTLLRMIAGFEDMTKVILSCLARRLRACHPTSDR